MYTHDSACMSREETYKAARATYTIEHTCEGQWWPKNTVNNTQTTRILHFCSVCYVGVKTCIDQLIKYQLLSFLVVYFIIIINKLSVKSFQNSR